MNTSMPHPSTVGKWFVCTLSIALIGLFASAALAAKSQSNIYWPNGTKLNATVDGGTIHVQWTAPLVTAGSLSSYRIVAFQHKAEIWNNLLDPTATDTFIEPSAPGNVTIYLIAFDDSGNSAQLKTRVRYP